MAGRVQVVLTDIEGTLSSISFVRDVLFPYARERLAGFLAAQSAEPAVAAEIEATRDLAGLSATAPLTEVAAVLCQWIDEDRKAPPLKALQGMIWRQGYEDGALVAELYDDALLALRQWDAAGVPLFVYSSGSVEAQQLFFAHTSAGDLLPLFQEFFDTRTGSKLEAESYQTICAISGYAPPEVLFLTDSVGEAVAAKAAGLQVALLDRAQVGLGGVPEGVPVMVRFDQLPPDLSPR